VDASASDDNGDGDGDDDDDDDDGNDGAGTAVSVSGVRVGNALKPGAGGAPPPVAGVAAVAKRPAKPDDGHGAVEARVVSSAEPKLDGCGAAADAATRVERGSAPSTPTPPTGAPVVRSASARNVVVVSTSRSVGSGVAPTSDADGAFKTRTARTAEAANLARRMRTRARLTSNGNASGARAVSAATLVTAANCNCVAVTEFTDSVVPNTNPVAAIATAGTTAAAAAIAEEVVAGTTTAADAWPGDVTAAAADAGTVPADPARAASGNRAASSDTSGPGDTARADSRDVNGDAARSPVAPVPTTPAFVAMLTLLNVAVSACCAGGADIAAAPNAGG
jgi:hypothetical protein